MGKKPTGDITICRLYQGLRFHTQREDGTNPTSIQPTKRNCSSNNNSLQKHQSESTFTGWRHRIRWHCSRNTTRDTLAPYLFIICLDYMLRTSIDKIRENGFELTKNGFELIIWKSDLTNKMKRSFFQGAVISILLYGCTTKQLKKKLDGNYTRLLRAILNKSWQQHPTWHQLYSHLPPVMKTIQVRWTRYAGHCLRSKDELISDVLLWTPAYGQAKAGRPVWTYIQQLCEDTGCSPEDLPEAMNDREKWRERVRVIRANGITWWWWKG